MGNRLPPIDYVEPTGIEDARRRKSELGLYIQSIQTQLADRDRQVDGRRLTDREYHQWRHKALVALNCKYEELRRVKEYLSRATASDPFSPDAVNGPTRRSAFLEARCWRCGQSCRATQLTSKRHWRLSTRL